MDEVSNGAFSKRSLPQEASFHVPVDNTELPEMENVFLETMNSVQTQIASVTSEQIPDVQLICELDTIDPDVLEYDVQTINSNGMNNTLSTPMTDGAIESLKGLEGMIKDLTVRANKTDDSLNSVLGEMVTVRISVKKVEQSFDALETSLKTVDTKAKQMDTRLIGVVENLNKVLQDYEDQFEVHDNRLLEIKDDAGKALAETNTNSIMIEEVCKIVSTQKEVLRKLTAPNGPNLNTISLDCPSTLRVSTIERNSVHARTSVTPSPMEDSIVSASDSRNDHSSMFQDLGSLSSIVRQAHSQIVVMDDLDVNCDNDVGLRQPDNNPGFQPVQVGREDRVQRRDLQHHQDKNSDNGVRTSIRSSRERGSLSSSPPRSRKRDNSMKREVAENKLRRKIAELKKIIANNLLNAKTSEAEIKDAVVRQVPVLNELIESCDNAMEKYSEFSVIDEELMDLLSSTIEEAGTWKDQAESLYKSAEIYDSNSGSRLDIVVKPFSGSGDQTVYAFLRDFENSFRGQGNDAKKVSQLYNHYLSNKVKFQASKMSKNYSDLKEWLVDRYGNPVTIVDTLLSKVESNPKPSSTNLAKKAEHFMMLDFVLSEIDETSNEAAIDKSDYQQHLYSQPIMKRIIDLIPYEDKLIFFKLLRKQGLDSKLVRGERAFFTLRQFVDNEAEAHSSNTPDIVQEETSKVEQSAAAVACPLLDDEEPDPEEHRQDERPTVLVAQMGQPQPARSTTTKPAGWYSSMLTFPCPIDNHNHELATCTEFFSSTPKQRRDIGRKKICFVCMGPLDKCVKKKNGNKLVRMCVNVKKAGPLSCRACADYCRACGISSPPFCVIMCQDPSHPKPTIEEVGRVLNDYWPSFNPDTVTPSMVLSGGSLHNTVSMIPPCVKSSARLHVDPFEVIFDTQTGNSFRVGMNEGQKSNFPTPSEAQANPSIFVMQWLRIGSTDCLCFFDSGANIHMISGELAEKEGVKMVSQESTVLKILGKGEVATDYGTYRLNMSTTDQTGYQSFICHGLSEIAGPFDKHSLDKVNSELRATMEYSTFNAATLPDYVGGSKVHLLLGIHAQVLPVHLFTLPSGISVYRSPFTDIFGSNICYGGTHESFKKSTTPLGASHAVHFMSVISQVQSCMKGLTQSVMDVFDSELLPGKDYFDPEHHSEKPSPLEDHLESFATPLKDHGYIVSDDMRDSYDPLDISCGTFSQSSSVHKAMIPIAKLRNMVAPDDGGTLVSYRCPSCAKCVKCKESPRTRAITLTETVEQDIIEKSVFIDYLKKTVFVDLPFLQDPVLFLKQRHNGPNNYFSAFTVYVQQCKKPVMLKDKMKEAHADLVSKGFMTKMDEMGTEVKQKVSDAPFHHYYPWRIVAKEDSVSTPIRMIVDPTMTGLNLILAKGENRLGNLAEILIRNRVKRFAWSSDISKMYNQLKLNESAYPYSLFLFNQALQSDIPPDVWVMLVAWYGVTPTGNQAGLPSMRW